MVIVKKQGTLYYLYEKDPKGKADKPLLFGPSRVHQGFNSEQIANNVYANNMESFTTRDQTATDLKTNSLRFRAATDSIKTAQENLKLQHQIKENKLQIELDSLKVQNQKISNEKDSLKLAVDKMPVATLDLATYDKDFLQMIGMTDSSKSHIFYDQLEFNRFQKSYQEWIINKEKVKQEQFATKSDSLSTLIDEEKLQSQAFETQSDSLEVELDEERLENQRLENTRDSLNIVNKKLQMEFDKEMDSLKLDLQNKKITNQQYENEIDSLRLEIKKKDKKLGVKANEGGLSASDIKKYKNNLNDAITKYVAAYRRGKTTDMHQAEIDAIKSELLEADRLYWKPILDKFDSELDTRIKEIDDYNNMNPFMRWVDDTFGW